MQTEVGQMVSWAKAEALSAQIDGVKLLSLDWSPESWSLRVLASAKRLCSCGGDEA